MKVFRLFSTSALFLVLACSTAWASEYDKFIGTYRGETVDISNGKEYRRDLSVTIKKSDDGFTLEWVTTRIRADGSEKTKSYTIHFFPSGRGGIFSSAMKSNLFGGHEPLDPMKGDPYFWAHINGDTLTVNALLINDDGGYEILTYDRTVTDKGLDLRFNRFSNGVAQREINAILERVE
ncbi:MAG: hypothetical protein DHS20C01_07270 [marine bacterium B5-7]|nr:MAG: hypothetical protein DHS20C01_07270 [marine bacterium B5-7]